MTTLFRFGAQQYSSGQPTAHELAELARTNVRRLISLCTPSDPADFDEAGEAAGLGLKFVSLPISGSKDLCRQRVREFGRLLDDALRVGGVLVHCSSANRAGALIALDALFNHGLSTEAALSLGRSAGLASLEQVVREIGAEGGPVA